MNEVPLFEQLVDDFFEGLHKEAGLAKPPIIPTYDRIALTKHLERIYRKRWNLRHPDTSTHIRRCASVLGAVTLVMYRAARHGEDDDPIDPGAPPTEIAAVHIDQAREMYGHYTNSHPVKALRNVMHTQALLDEIDMPCPLCP
jgi:hypothetical protein